MLLIFAKAKENRHIHSYVYKFVALGRGNWVAEQQVLLELTFHYTIYPLVLVCFVMLNSTKIIIFEV